MKLYSEEKPGLKQGLGINKFLFLFFILSSSALSQIPINGFCKYDAVETERGFSSLFSLNFNNDSFTDLIAYSPQSKTANLLTGGSSFSFTQQNKINFPFELTRINPIYSRKNLLKGFAFTSRKNLTAGTAIFNARGIPSIQSSFQFKSYPENVSAADINLNGDYELLVSGSSFDGLSLLIPGGKNFKEKKILEGTTFTNAMFVDLSGDGYPDIAGFNLSKYELMFFYNDGTGEFYKTRSIKFPQRISSFKTADLNLDSYSDLYFISGKEINIIYGDSISSFNKRVKLYSKNPPYKIISGDFNKDGKMDIASLSKTSGIVSVFFAKDNFDYYQEMIYLEDKNLIDIAPYYSKFVTAIAALSSSGKIHFISNLSSTLTEACIKTGLSPSAINYFDYEGNGISDVVYIDDKASTLNFILRNSEGIFAKFFSTNLYEKADQILTESISGDKKYFICYSPGKKFIELIKMDFSSFKAEKKIIYSPGKIEQIIPSVKNGALTLSFLYRLKNKLLAGSFEQKGNDFQFKFNGFEEENINDAAFINLKENRIIFSKVKHDSITFVFSKISLQSSKEEIKIFNDSLMRMALFSNDLLNNETSAMVSFLKGKSRNKILVSIEEKGFYLKEAIPEGFYPEKKSNLFYGAVRNNGLKKLFAYIPALKSLYRFDFIKGGSQLQLTKLFKDLELNSYFVKNLNSRDIHLVYTGKSLKCIYIKPLP